MRRRSCATVVTLLLAVAASGCASQDDPQPAAALRHFALQAPPLPPPDPAAYEPARPKGRDDGAPRATPPAAAPATEQGVPSDAEVARELRQALGAGKDASTRALIERATVTAAGLATVPPGAPARVAAIIRGANEVARKPYVYGGGHGRLAGETWIDTAYDCSGSVSFALATAGLVDAPMASGALASWGRPGPGRWVTIYANGGHAFMTVAGLRFDTSGRAQAGTRWQQTARTVSGFTLRHPPGL